MHRGRGCHVPTLTAGLCTALPQRLDTRPGLREVIVHQDHTMLAESRLRAFEVSICLDTRIKFNTVTVQSKRRVDVVDCRESVRVRLTDLLELRDGRKVELLCHSIAHTYLNLFLRRALHGQLGGPAYN